MVVVPATAGVEAAPADVARARMAMATTAARAAIAVKCTGLIRGECFVLSLVAAEVALFL